MPNLDWSDALALQLPVMDDTHREFVELLAQVETVADSAPLAHWRVLLDHTAEHFTPCSDTRVADPIAQTA